MCRVVFVQCVVMGVSRRLVQCVVMGVSRRLVQCVVTSGAVHYHGMSCRVSSHTSIPHYTPTAAQHELCWHVLSNLVPCAIPYSSVV